jgi:hypothetical protein
MIEGVMQYWLCGDVHGPDFLPFNAHFNQRGNASIINSAVFLTSL